VPGEYPAKTAAKAGQRYICRQLPNRPDMAEKQEYGKAVNHG